MGKVVVSLLFTNWLQLKKRKAMLNIMTIFFFFFPDSLDSDSYSYNFLSNLLLLAVTKKFGRKSRGKFANVLTLVN